MNIQLSDDQLMLQQAARKFLQSELTTTLIKELQEKENSGHSEVLWKKIANLGWLGVTLPEKYHGGELTLVDLGILYEEAGRALMPTTFYSTIYASLLVSILGTEKQKDYYLTKIAKGELIATVAYSEKNVLNNPDLFESHAEKNKNKWILSGSKYFVPNAHLADLIVVISRSSDEIGNQGLTAFLLHPNRHNVSIEPMLTFGKDRQSIVTFSNIELDETDILGGAENAANGLDLAMQQATALQCAEMAGGARKVVDMTALYVSERQQFGVPIGSFQAVQHQMADMLTFADGAKVLAYQALSFLSEGKPSNKEVSIAKSFASEGYKTITVMAHQLWGGMGYSTESDLYLWSNRAKTTELSFGTQDTHLNRIAELLTS